MTAADLIRDFGAREPKARANADWLAGQRAFATGFASIDAMVLADNSKIDARLQKGFDHHLRHLRAALARTLMRHECFVGLSVIDELIFEAVTAGASDVAAEVIRTIFGHNLQEPGMVVIPLHSFGIARPMAEMLNQGTAQLLYPAAGLVVSSQTGDVPKTIAMLDAARTPLGISAAFDDTGIHSYTAAGRLGWLHRNPLLAFRFSTYSHEPYENQLFYQLRMRTLTALLLTASLHAPPHPGDIGTDRANNQETFDLDHYLKIEFSPRLGRLEIQRIPRNIDETTLAEASDIDVRISRAGWEGLVGSGALDPIHLTLRHIEDGVLSHRIMDNRETKEAGLYAKLARSVDYYRRSFRKGARTSERVISLAIAFESLLTDSYSGGVTRRILRRARICLDRAGAPVDWNAEIARLFDARGKFVHSGFGPEALNLQTPRLAYFACLSAVVDAAQVATLSDPVIGGLLADKPQKMPPLARLRRAWRSLWAED
jgi:hypothetical protein